MSWYPLIEKGQQSYEYAFLRASGAMLLRFVASLKRVNGDIILENVPVPPCSILLPMKTITNLLLESKIGVEKIFYASIIFKLLEDILSTFPSLKQ